MRNLFYRFTALLVCVLAIVLFVACEGDGTGTTDAASTASTASTMGTTGTTNAGTTTAQNAAETTVGVGQTTANESANTTAGQSADTTVRSPETSAAQTTQNTPAPETTVETTVFRLSDLEPMEALAYLADVMNNAAGYKITTTGTVVAKALFTNTTQNVLSETVKSGHEFYYTSSSASSLVKSYHTAYFNGGKVVYADEEKGGDIGGYTVATLADYKDKYGTSPTVFTWEGFVITAETVDSLTLESNKNGRCTYLLVLKNFDVAAKDMRLQMKEFGGLSSLPTFSAISLRIVATEEGLPVESYLSSAYSAKMSLINATCTQELHTVYEGVGQTQTIPNRDAFVAKMKG